MAVAAGGEASKEVTNTYERVVTGTATIKVEKAVSGTRWPNGGEVTFTIARKEGEGDPNGPLPDPLTTEVQTEAGEKMFIASLFWKKLQTFLENVASPFWRNVHLHGATYAAPWKQTFFVKSY